ncbi:MULTISPECIES: hypothetical protein [Pseudomonas]|uniref:Uncharacterized protein n=1 Tax=Pseudomonas hunanensis TaxID=1247546 RepID=A0ACC9MY48_9PSED|nr:MULTISPECIES: hypothetical protein [Pseudomonas]HCF2575487.1 hypothetical protein [Pseudomonas aeruginosa]AGN82262.1 hypothetical protein L483_15040 [Pseudomonas putida H8234]MBP2086310.1 hypothetical protein [Pseudomonas sp. PvP089]MBP2092702.1 hypothetical protein [Pseudomonas sp. PvP088]MBP2226480.1 hypothetical protein [Pseudomonas putida]
MAKEKLITRISEIAESLNERQRAYLIVAYDEDQRAEEVNSGPGSAPASQWRWLEYGPDGRVRKMTYDGPLRYALAEMKLVGHGAGSTWHSLENRGLLSTDHRPIGMGDLLSLFVRLTTDGRRVARVLKGLPMQKPKIDAASKPMSLTGLRILHQGQQQPTEYLDPFEPWIGRSYYPPPLVVLGIARGLANKGLLVADRRKLSFKISAAGLAVAIEEAENWKPFARPAYGEPGWIEDVLSKVRS